jgi:hypothetical protein
MNEGLHTPQHRETKRRRPSEVTDLAKFVLEGEPRAELFHTPGADGVPYATIVVDGHLETWPLHARLFRHYLERRVYRATGRMPSAHAIRAALGVLTGEALFGGLERPVFTRVAAHGDAIYLDLGDPAWRAVEITRRGWRVVARPPVKFRRARGMLALPSPIPGGSLHALRSFVNVADNGDYRLLITWLLAALRPRGPYPLLVVHGEQGAAKSTTARVLRQLCDPNTAPLRAAPRELRDLMIAATNGWVVCFDNLDHLVPWISNALCRLSTGGGFSTRRHYSDDGEVLFDATRPIVVNGIEELATRGDLLDRAIILHLPTIAEPQRRAEAAFWEDFECVRPGLLGGLLDALVEALAVLPTVTLPGLPRMADFARFGVAVERAVDWPPGTFLATYGANREAAHDLTLEASLLAGPIRDFVPTVGAWTGPATDLLDALMQRVGEPIRRRREWPQTPTALSSQLRRLAPTLRTVGVDVLFHRSARHRRITLKVVPLREPASSASSTSSASSGSGTQS